MGKSQAHQHGRRRRTGRGAGGGAAGRRLAARARAREERAPGGRPAGEGVAAEGAAEARDRADRFMEELWERFERLEAEAEAGTPAPMSDPVPPAEGPPAAGAADSPVPAKRVRFARARRFMGADRAMAQHRRVLGEGYRLLRHNPGAPVLVFGTVIVAAASRPLALHHHVTLASLTSWLLGALVVLVYVLRTRMLAGLTADLAAARRILASGTIPPAYASRFGRRVVLPLARRCLRARVDAGAGPPRAGG